MSEEALLRQAVAYWGEALVAVSFALGLQQHVAEDLRASVRFLQAREERARSAAAANARNECERAFAWPITMGMATENFQKVL